MPLSVQLQLTQPKARATDAGSFRPLRDAPPGIIIRATLADPGSGHLLRQLNSPARQSPKLAATLGVHDAANFRTQLSAFLCKIA